MNKTLELSVDERQVIELYRTLDEPNKSLVINLLVNLRVPSEKIFHSINNVSIGDNSNVAIGGTIHFDQGKESGDDE